MISKNAFYFSSISNSQITNYRQNEKQNCHQVKDNINQFSFLVDLDHENVACNSNQGKSKDNPKYCLLHQIKSSFFILRSLIGKIIFVIDNIHFVKQLA